MKDDLWTREEMILAFNLYLKLPFGKMHTRTPEIIELTNLMGRTVNSVTLRLVNFASKISAKARVFGWHLDCVFEKCNKIAN